MNDIVDVQSSPNSERNKKSKQRKSLEGAKQGWNNFMKQSAAGMAKFTTQRRVGKDTMEGDGARSPPPPPNNSPKSEANRSDELKEMRGGENGRTASRKKCNLH